MVTGAKKELPLYEPFCGNNTDRKILGDISNNARSPKKVELSLLPKSSSVTYAKQQQHQEFSELARQLHRVKRRLFLTAVENHENPVDILRAKFLQMAIDKAENKEKDNLLHKIRSSPNDFSTYNMNHPESNCNDRINHRVTEAAPPKKDIKTPTMGEAPLTKKSSISYNKLMGEELSETTRKLRRTKRRLFLQAVEEQEKPVDGLRAVFLRSAVDTTEKDTTDKDIDTASSISLSLSSSPSTLSTDHLTSCDEDVSSETIFW